MWRVSVLLVMALSVCGAAVWMSRSADGSATQDNLSAPDGSPETSRTPGAENHLLLSKDRPGLPPGGTTPAHSHALHDPVVLSACSLTPRQEQEVSSQIDGVFQEILVELGEHVRPGQVLGRLDDRQLRPQVDLLQIKASSRAAELVAKAQHDEADRRVEYARKANESGLRAVSELEYNTYFFQRERFAREMEKAREEQEVARKELARTLHLLELHEIRSRLAGEVTRDFKRKGETVRQGEPLFRVADFSRLRIDGFVKAQQAELVRVGMRALVEPELPGTQMTTLRGHTGAVTSLAVSPDGSLLASASEDRTVILWNWPAATRRGVLSHPAEVQAVALAQNPGKKGQLLISGCADGRIRAWSVADDGVGTGPETWAGHEGAVRALAFSPDGHWCASGGEDRRIAVWDTTTGRRLYWLRPDGDEGDTAHQGAVTSLHFTPDGRLVSAGRDNTLKVWTLGTEGGKLAACYPGRTGEVPQLGVSPDGSRLLFDHGDTVRILGRDGGASLATLACRRQGRFQGSALFSPTGRLVLAAGSNGRVQLFRTPALPEAVAFFRRASAHGLRPASLVALGGLGSGGTLAAPLTVSSSLAVAQGETPLPSLWPLHGQEIRSFLAPNTAGITCAAFAPDESVAFTGGTDQVVRVWSVPPPVEWSQPREAVVTFVGSQVERGTDRIRVRAEMENPPGQAGRLRPGTNVDLRLYPETAPSTER